MSRNGARAASLTGKQTLLGIRLADDFFQFFLRIIPAARISFGFCGSGQGFWRAGVTLSNRPGGVANLLLTKTRRELHSGPALVRSRYSFNRKINKK